MSVLKDESIRCLAVRLTPLSDDLGFAASFAISSGPGSVRLAPFGETNPIGLTRPYRIHQRERRRPGWAIAQSPGAKSAAQIVAVDESKAKVTKNRIGTPHLYSGLYSVKLIRHFGKTNP